MRSSSLVLTFFSWFFMLPVFLHRAPSKRERALWSQTVTDLKHWVSPLLRGIFSLTFIFLGWLSTLVQLCLASWPLSHTKHYMKDSKVWACEFIKQCGERDREEKERGSKTGRATDNNLFNTLASPRWFFLQSHTVTKALNLNIRVPNSAYVFFLFCLCLLQL